jgi:hypothetical protein
MKKSVVLFLMVMLLLTGSKVNNLKRHNNFRVQSNYAYAVEPEDLYQTMAYCTMWGLTFACTTRQLSEKCWRGHCIVPY